MMHVGHLPCAFGQIYKITSYSAAVWWQRTSSREQGFPVSMVALDQWWLAVIWYFVGGQLQVVTLLYVTGRKQS